MSTRCTVLIVEDDNDIRDALCQVLEEEGYRVVSAPNGKAGLELMRQHQPHVILLDLMMPVMNGWQFREEQQGDPMFASVPVVVISADTSGGHEARSLGARAFLQKPVELQELLSTVAQQMPA